MEGCSPYIDIGPTTGIAITHEGILTLQENAGTFCTPIHQMEEQNVDELKSVLETCRIKDLTAIEQQQREDEISARDNDETRK